MSIRVIFPLSGPLFLEIGLSHSVMTLSSEYVIFALITFCHLMEAASCVSFGLLSGTDGSHEASPLTALICWFKNMLCQSLCFYFPVGKSWCCHTRTAVRSYTEPWSPGGNAFSQRLTVPNLDQDWEQWGGLRFRSGRYFMYLAWNSPGQLSYTHTL